MISTEGKQSREMLAVRADVPEHVRKLCTEGYWGLSGVERLKLKRQVDHRSDARRSRAKRAAMTPAELVECNR